MAFTTHTVTGNILDGLQRAGINLTRLAVYAEPSQEVINDASSNLQQFGNVPIVIEEDGTFVVDLIETSETTLAGWTIVVVWRDQAFRSVETTTRFGPFPITANRTFGEILADGYLVLQPVDVETLESVYSARDDAFLAVTDAETARDNAAAAQLEAEAAAADAVDISNISTSDGVVEALVKGTAGQGPLTRAAIDTLTATKLVDSTTASGAAVDAARLSPLRGVGGVPDSPWLRSGTNATTGATSSTASITKPTAAAVGDTILVFMSVIGAALPTAPSGWSLLGTGTYSNGTDRVAAYAHRVGLVDAGPYIFTFAGSTTWRAAVGAYMGLKTPYPAAVTASDASGTVRTIPAGTYPARGIHVIATFQNSGAGTQTALGNYTTIASGAGIRVFQRPMAGANTYTATTTTGNGTDLGATIVLSLEVEPVMFANRFESADLTGYSIGIQGGATDPVVITDPTTFGLTGTRKVARCSVLATQVRAELGAGGPGSGTAFYPNQIVAGDDIYFAWAYYLPADYVTPASWQLVRQWKADRPSTTTPGAGTDAVSPVVGLAAGSYGHSRWIVNAAGWPRVGAGEGHSFADLALGHWNKGVTRIKFSETPGTSIVQCWFGIDNEPVKLVFDSDHKVSETLNGQPVELRAGWWPRYAAETAGSQGGTARIGWVGTHERQGIYRDSTMTSDAHILTGGSCWGRTLAAALAA